MARRALITGAAGTFGLHITAGLIAAGFETLAVVRSTVRGADLAARVAPLTVGAPSSGRLVIVVADLSSSKSISDALGAALPAGSILDVLVNNAAYVPAGGKEVLHGVEAQWAVSVLGYQRVLRASLPALLAAPAPRVVFVASNYAGGLDLADPEFKTRAYDSNAAYMQSKQANRMLGRAWAARQPRLTVFSCHPGIADSAVARGLGMSFSDAEAAGRAGAATPLYAALSPAAAQAPSGTYFSACAPARCRFSEDSAAVDKLWTLVESYN